MATFGGPQSKRRIWANSTKSSSLQNGHFPATIRRPPGTKRTALKRKFLRAKSPSRAQYIYHSRPRYESATHITYLLLTLAELYRLANKNWLKVAELSAIADKPDYYKSIEIFEKVAQKSISSNLMRYSVKEYLLKAGLCHLATGDLISVQRALEKYRDMDPSFTTTREHQLLVDLTESIEAGDADKFSEKLFQYDQMSKLDKWKTSILLQIKSKIEEADNEFS